MSLSDGSKIDVDDADKHFRGVLTRERIAKIEAVVSQRTFTNSVVLENIYDRGNMSAVMRLAEAFGLADFHIIELSEKLKESQRTTAGADKWLEVQRWKSTKSCLEKLKSQGKKIYVTHLDATAKSIFEIDWSLPAALVLGNEKDGASAEALALADQAVIIPMRGFVQSFNISVAAALAISEMARTLRGPLDEAQKKRLAVEYFFRTLDSSDKVLSELKSRGSIG